MKKYSILVLALVLTAALFTGCGCRNNQVSPTTTRPTTVPTTQATEATRATTEATTHATTEPITGTDATIENGNGPLPTDATGETHTGAAGEGRARHMPPAAK